MNLPQNLFDGSLDTQVFLCQPNKARIGEILPDDLSGRFKFNSYSEINFSINKYYNDLFDGTTKVNPYYKLIDSLRIIEIRGVGHFVIQDVKEDESDTFTKSITCFSLEYSTGQKYLESFYVNTGEEGSVETMYHSKQYGAEYSIDNYYTLINTETDKFDPYERYYIKKYVDGSDSSYNYAEVSILDADDYKDNYQGKDSETTLYIKKYPNVRFYWPNCKELSLLHLVFSLIPEWKIGHVDKELWYQERTFKEERTSVYDFLYNKAADTFKFVMVWDSVNGTCSFYKTEEDGITTHNYVRTNTYNPNFIYYSDDKGTIAEEQPTTEDEVTEKGLYINVGQGIETQWDTDVFISHENLASSVDIRYSTDDIKTKLKVTGSDALDVRDVNLGQNYILNLSFYNTPLWMGKDLSYKYTQYTGFLQEKSEEYKALISQWSAVYNEYNDLMNDVPVEPGVLLVGDTFDKLYCTYGITKATEYVADKQYYTADGGKVSLTEDDAENISQYYINTVQLQLPVLKQKLGLYRVGVDDKGEISKVNKSDDVLLTLENDALDSATIRVKCTYKPDTKKYENYEYQVVRTITYAATGYINTEYFTLEEWVRGDLVADYNSDGRQMALSDFKVKSIGTLGAYLCLVKDETQKENVEEYGIRLLQEKQDIYTKIFITQTEGYMSKEGSQCVATDKEPTGQITVGSKWLDTNSIDATVYIYVGAGKGEHGDSQAWDVYKVGNESADFENYTRFIDNYEKLQVVQEVLKEKQYKSNLLLNGVAYDEFYLTDKNITEDNLSRIVDTHLIVTNNPYTRSAVQPSTDYEIEGAVWFQPTTTKERVYHYLNEQWVEYNESEIITMTQRKNVKFYDSDRDIGLVYMTFTSETDNNNYVIYVSNGIPYVCYAHAQGLISTKMNVIKERADMNNYFSEEELMRLSPFIREDVFSDANFLLTGYESEEEQMNIKQELLDAGNEELNKICQPKLSFNMDMANILSIPEFAPIKKQFKLGNFVRVGIREGYVKRARLLEVQINFEDDSDFSCTFGDLISTKSEIDKHAELLQQAVTVSKSVASNQSHWQKGADKATKLDQAINDGLSSATLEVGRANGQSLIWNDQGIWCRKLVDGTTDQYDPEQIRIINNKILYSTDGFRSAESAFGSFEYKGQKYSGVIARALVGGVVHGAEIFGGKMEIGGTEGKFVVNEDGSVQILGPDGETPVYVTQDAIDFVSQARQYHIELLYDGSTIFSQPGQLCTIVCKVYSWDDDITEDLPDSTTFSWLRNGVVYKTTSEPTITIGNDDISGNAQFSCRVQFDETKL